MGDRSRPDARPRAQRRAIAGPERLGKTPLAAVLEVAWNARRTIPRNGRAPLQLEERPRDRRGEPDRDARRPRQPRVEDRRAGGAQRRALVAAPDADRREREVESTGARCAAVPPDRGGSGRVHRSTLARVGSLRRYRAFVAPSAGLIRRSGPGRPRCRPWPSRSGHQPGRRPRRSCRPAAPGRRVRRARGARGPVHARRPRWTDSDGPNASGTRAPRRPDEDRVDREAHEHHVDPVAVGQPEARRPAAATTGPSGP